MAQIGIGKIATSSVKIKDVTLNGTDAQLFNEYVLAYKEKYEEDVDQATFAAHLILKAIQSDKTFMKGRS